MSVNPYRSPMTNRERADRAAMASTEGARLPLIGRPYCPNASIAMRTAMVFIPANRGALADPDVHAALCVLIQMTTSGSVRRPTIRLAFKQARRADYEAAVRKFCDAIGAWRSRQGLI